MSTTVVLWHGQYSNDGRERLAILKKHERTLFGLHDPRLVGQAGAWYLIADAYEYTPSEHHTQLGKLGTFGVPR